MALTTLYMYVCTCIYTPYVCTIFYLTDDVHDPYGTVAVELSCLQVASSILTQQSDQGGGTVPRLTQDHRRVGRN